MLTLSAPSMALNLNISRPVDADRLGISGHVTFVADCAKKIARVVDYTNIFYAKNVRKNEKAICYGDTKKYIVTLVYGKNKGAWHEKNMLSTDPGRYVYTPVVFTEK